MINRYFRCLPILVLAAMVGCTSLPFRLGDGSQVTPITLERTLSPTVSLTLEAKQTAHPTTPGETDAATLPTGGLLVRIWLPPEFDPAGGSPASKLLKARLEEFETENPDIRLETRVKTLEGSGGLLESLVAANAAAPLALPDLVLLPRPLLESATLKGLLYPYDGLTSIMDDQSWFEYAKQSAEIKTSTYGIPFAGDALVLAYHPSLLETVPITLETTLSLGEVLLYPATDPQALFTLGMYLADGGSLQDEQGRPSLDEATLTNILEFVQRASMAGVMPYWLTQYSNDAQVWEAFVGNQYPMAITWTSSFLDHKQAAPADLALAPIPTPNDTPFTLATGWSWALAGQDPERRTQAIRLAEYLVDKEFLAEWTYAAGYLPPRADALQSWQDAELRQLIEQISYSARLMPPADIVSSLGPALEQAVVDVLKAQSDPQTAAQTVIDQINQP
jgi:ABC-type glycerol-3-phosphate transport system substrate-binding protein